MISTADQLAELAQEVNTGIDYAGVYFEMAKDIDLSDYASWTPIGRGPTESDPAMPFKGNFNGASHVISGLTIDDDSLRYAGLFGVMDGSVKNLGLVDVDINAFYYVGALAGYVGYGNTATVEKCYVSGGTVQGDLIAGGLIGVLRNSSAKNCYATCDVTGVGENHEGQVTGGLVGRVWSEGAPSDSILQDSYSTGKVTGDMYVGGVVGHLASGTVQSCYTTSELVVWDDWAGGIAGHVVFNGEIKNCFAITSGVTGKTHPNLVWNRITNKDSENDGVYQGNYGLILQELPHMPYPAGIPYPAGQDGVDGQDLTSIDIAAGLLVSKLLPGNGWTHNHPDALPTLNLGIENTPIPPAARVAEVLSVAPSGTGKALSGTLTITFNKAMNTSVVGAVTLSTSALGSSHITLGMPQVWSEDKKVCYISYSGLSYSGLYGVNIDGFKDYAPTTVTDDSHTFQTLSAPSGGGGGGGGGGGTAPTTTSPGLNTTGGSLGNGGGANRISIRTATVTAASRSLSYTGSAQRPAIKVVLDGKTLTPGVDYSVTYKVNTAIGTAMVTVHGEGSYIDGASAKFSIVPTKTGILRLTPTKGKLKVQWKKVPAVQKVTNYQVRYRAEGSSKWYVRTVKSNVSVVTLQKRLMKNKRYYVMVRSFKTINDTRYYSAWSAVKLSQQVK
jgi:hypothetical protein